MTSDSGPRIKDIRGGRTLFIDYARGDRSITVEGEPMVGTPLMVLYAGSIRTWRDGAPVTEAERAEIIHDIRSLLRPKWGEIEVDHRPYPQA